MGALREAPGQAGGPSGGLSFKCRGCMPVSEDGSEPHRCQVQVPQQSGTQDPGASKAKRGHRRASDTRSITLPCVSPNSKGCWSLNSENTASLLDLIIPWRESRLSHQPLSQLRHCVSQGLINLFPAIKPVFWKVGYPGSRI